MVQGVMGAYISNARMDAEWMVNMNKTSVAEAFDLQTSHEVEIQPGITTYEDSPLATLAEQISGVLVESGTVLMNYGYEDFATLVIDVTTNDMNDGLKGEILVEKLVNMFPALQDISNHVTKSSKEDEQDTIVRAFHIKKAQLMVADLFRRFSESEKKLFAFEDTDAFTVFSDNVLPAVLRKLDILKVTEELESYLDSKEPLMRGNAEVELRSAAIVASERIVQVFNQQNQEQEWGKQDMTPLTLDYYLWKLGKQEGFRTFERHYTQNTVYY
eukprot:TRINITY_DN2634_c1_g1_i4.p1 TRINITY_DN2634_c1_g1~~TRINITY_DN2634_c1_g1_i4.p1  ORF type:complete len:272 (+),score=103.97 TRINITY_DN2634_c1_g1_i4:522-1337(+)